MSEPIQFVGALDGDQLQRLEDRIVERVLQQVRPIELERLLTVAEVAEIFGVDEVWVRRRQADLGAYKLSEGGGRSPLRFKASTVQKYLDRHQLKAPPAARSWREDQRWALP